ncbi:MAG TPA: hypothetical protein VHW60_00530 [Caulobacteraceae bacterium]|jgi:hypothetical protein|nr:hypothetical protein [Caulobacteraceae bacterium]
MAAYGHAADLQRVSNGLQAAAQALNHGDVSRAMILSLHLRLPEVDTAGAARIAAVGQVLAKYDPNEPRDWRGRWTTGGGASAPSPIEPPRLDASTLTPAPPGPRGGRLIPVQIEGDPPEEGREDERDDDERDDETTPPRLLSGRPWPEADPDIIRQILRSPPDRSLPRLRILVPINGRGPTLLGATTTEEFNTIPPGYRAVEFYGTPQETLRQGIGTNHARDSVEQALDEARIDPNLREVWFNRAITTSTRGQVVMRLRPDVLAVYDAGLGLPPRFGPMESYSPGQDPDARAEDLRHPSLEGVRGRFYNMLRKLWMRWLRKAGS